MIVWLASYPRSGNTFARIVLRHVYDVPTYTVARAADDLSYDKGESGGDLTGNRYLEDLYPDGRFPKDYEGFLADLEAREEIFFVKTHKFDHGGPSRDFRTIVFCRHPADVFVSLANYHLDVYFTFKRYWKSLRDIDWSYFNRYTVSSLFRNLILTIGLSVKKRIGLRDKVVRTIFQDQTRFGLWERFHKDWLDERSNDKVTVIRFRDLIKDPVVAMEKALSDLNLDMKAVGGKVPTFEELKAVHPTFFRKGKSGSGKTEMPAELIEACSKQFEDRIKQLGL